MRERFAKHAQRVFDGLVSADKKVKAMQEAMLLMGDAIEARKTTVPHRAVELSLKYDFDLFRKETQHEQVCATLPRRQRA